MNIKQTLTRVFLGIFFVSALSFAVLAEPAFAQGDKGCETNTSIITCDIDEGADGIEGTGLWSVLILAINILTALVGVAALGGIVYGAALYTAAGGNAEQTKKAMGIITNVVIGVIAFALMFAFLNFIIPGGVFN